MIQFFSMYKPSCAVSIDTTDEIDATGVGYTIECDETRQHYLITSAEDLLHLSHNRDTLTPVSGQS